MWFSFEDEDSGSFEAQFKEACTLSYQTRLIACGIFLGLGIIFDIVAVTSLPNIVLHPQTFAIFYTLSSIASIGATMFLWGPCSQLKQMFKKKRVVATSVYLGSMILTLVCAYELQSVWLVVLCLVIQFLAMIWYCASYIPYGRAILTGCTKNCCKQALLP